MLDDGNILFLVCWFNLISFDLVTAKFLLCDACMKVNVIH